MERAGLQYFGRMGSYLCHADGAEHRPSQRRICSVNVSLIAGQAFYEAAVSGRGWPRVFEEHNRNYITTAQDFLRKQKQGFPAGADKANGIVQAIVLLMVPKSGIPGNLFSLV